MKVWVLTEEYNDYDQHGEYFVAVFGSKPTDEKLTEAMAWPYNGEYLEHIRNGGGRRGYENHWYNLNEIEMI